MVQTLEAEENRLLSLKLTAQIHDVNQMGEVIQTIPEKNKTKVYGGEQVFFSEKRRKDL